ncbi:MAG: isochorismate synthase [Syntrophobacterales bacterium]|nr:isochorismate synthase [Syntrophobacterales bacterium]
MINKNLADKINDLTRRNIPFVFYYHPGQPEPRLAAQTSQNLLTASSCREIKDTSGFIAAPFISQKKTPLVLLRPDIYLTDMASMPALENSLPSYPHIGENHTELVQTERDDYIRTAAELIARIKQKEAEKVVFSRIIPAYLPPDYSPGIFVQRLKERMDNAFVYFLRLPGIGTWMGATPEILLTTQGNRWKTTSLAGTMPVVSPSAAIIWGSKEKREQEIVTEFIETKLRLFGIDNYEKTGPHTVHAGQVAHLKTDIEFAAVEDHEKQWRFIDALHPTPAVCGVPREKAMNCIARYERHEREYYSGFLGEWNLAGEVNLYVNLRCMKILGEKAALLVGGGITAASVPEKEWEETEQKAQTLLSLLRSCP